MEENSLKIVYDEIDKLLEREAIEIRDGRSDAEILNIFLKECHGFFTLRKIKELEKGLQSFNGDKWGLARAIIKILGCNEESAKNATIIANLTMYILRRYPVDLSKIKPYVNEDVVKANFRCFRQKHPFI